MAPAPFIRPFKEEDTEMAKFICRATLPPSLASSEAGVRMAPYLWTLQFTYLFPEHAFVLDDGAGKCVGYVIGAPDVFVFAERYHEYVEGVLGSEQGRKDVPVPKQLTKLEPWEIVTGEGGEKKKRKEVNPECLAQTAYNINWLVLEGVEGKKELNEEYRAMLHIDMLEEFQGKGWGRKMIQTFVESVKKAAGEEKDEKGEKKYDYGKGINIGVAGENTKVVPFYEKCGFRVYPGGEKEGNVWMVLDL
ncbi:hypothetical protein QBC46DRAFT_379579 [Diplogelasinospora grovesii]|uniref:N-acetyltransferase domain-containing protein n=1 Tax=Diplogelasinospora grovesii TaxID=303347 RepID=A0AAN6NBD7_9PEZI|nr:hypothetical protein QBC46DRAFT_379579 [Diplogelasinospora grovesii]